VLGVDILQRLEKPRHICIIVTEILSDAILHHQNHCLHNILGVREPVGLSPTAHCRGLLCNCPREIYTVIVVDADGEAILILSEFNSWAQHLWNSANHVLIGEVSKAQRLPRYSVAHFIFAVLEVCAGGSSIFSKYTGKIDYCETLW